jgi:hypothetical protein
MAKKITKKRKPISKKIKHTKVAWVAPEWIDKELQNEDHSDLKQARDIQRDAPSFAQTAHEFVTKLDLLLATTIKLQGMMREATKQLEQPVKSIEQISEIFAKHL